MTDLSRRAFLGAAGAAAIGTASGPAVGQGFQLPPTPAELFRTAMRGIREDLSKAGRAEDGCPRARARGCVRH